MKDVVIIGGGDQAHYTIDIIHKEGKLNIIGIVDAQAKIGSRKHGYPILGRQESIKEIAETHQIDGGIITIGDNWTRYLVATEIKKQIPNFKFFNAIHPSCIIGKNVKFGSGVVAPPPFSVRRGLFNSNNGGEDINSSPLSTRCCCCC